MPSSTKIVVQTVTDAADLEELATIYAKALAPSSETTFANAESQPERHLRFRRSQLQRQLIAATDKKQCDLRGRSAACLLKAVEVEHDAQAPHDSATKKGRIVGVAAYDVVPSSKTFTLDEKSVQKSVEEADSLLPPLADSAEQSLQAREEEAQLLGDVERISVSVLAVEESANGQDASQALIGAIQEHAQRLSELPARIPTKDGPAPSPECFISVPVYVAPIPSVQSLEKASFELSSTRSAVWRPQRDTLVQDAVARLKDRGETVKVEPVTSLDDADKIGEIFLSAFTPGFELVFPRMNSLSLDSYRWRRSQIASQIISMNDPMQRSLRSGEGIDGLGPAPPRPYGVQILKAVADGIIVGFTFGFMVPGKKHPERTAEAYEALTKAGEEADKLLPPSEYPPAVTPAAWEGIMGEMHEREKELIGDEDHIHIAVIGADIRARAGVGKALIDAVIESGRTADSKLLPVHLDAMVGARGFYKKLGFKEYDPIGGPDSWGFFGWPSILRR